LPSIYSSTPLGATIVVSAAAVGGIMVPVYAMPPTMQQLSILSPLSWADQLFFRTAHPWQSLAEHVARCGQARSFFRRDAATLLEKSIQMRYTSLMSDFG
jgi:hypothetical protein